MLVKHNEVISQGFTQPPGQHHAQAMALSRLSVPASGVVAYITLEPCSFHGRTLSCAQALVRVGVERVFVGMLDPDPRNAGAGIEVLHRAGIDVVVGLLGEEVKVYLSQYLMSPLEMSSGSLGGDRHDPCFNHSGEHLSCRKKEPM